MCKGLESDEFWKRGINILQCMNKKGLSDEKTFPQKLGRSNGVSLTKIRGKSMEDGGKNKCRDPETTVCLMCPNHSRKAKAVNMEYMGKLENMLCKLLYFETCNYLLISLQNERINSRGEEISDLGSYPALSPSLLGRWDAKTSERLASQSGSLALNRQAIIAVI